MTKNNQNNDPSSADEREENKSAKDESVESPIQQEDIENQEAADSPEVETKTVEQERDEYLAGWQRAQADLQNLKKTHAEERSMFTTLGKESLLQELIPMLDNFEAAFANKEAWEQTPESWRIGIEYIYKQFLETLENNGVTQFGEEGDDFQSEMHEPVEMVAGEDDQKNKIVSVIQKGYKIGERVVRPAKVKVGE